MSEQQESFSMTQLSNLFDELEKQLNNIQDPHEQFLAIEKLVLLLKRFLPDINLLDNYNHRTVRLRLKIMENEAWKDFYLKPGRNKEDAVCPSRNLVDIESKTTNVELKNINHESFWKKKFMFDKQHIAGRREFIKKVDGLSFGLFWKEKLYWTFYTDDKETLANYRNIVEKKQREFQQKWETQSAKANGGYDTINIGLDDFDENSKWNVWLADGSEEGLHLTNKTLKEIKQILEIAPLQSLDTNSETEYEDFKEIEETENNYSL